MSPEVQRAIQIRFSFGDVVYFFDCVKFAVIQRRRDVISSGWKNYRSQLRQNVWRPYTLGDHIHTARMKKYLKHHPPQTARPVPWRHQ